MQQLKENGIKTIEMANKRERIAVRYKLIVRCSHGVIIWKTPKPERIVFTKNPFKNNYIYMRTLSIPLDRYINLDKIKKIPGVVDARIEQTPIKYNNNYNAGLVPLFLRFLTIEFDEGLTSKELILYKNSKLFHGLNITNFRVTERLK